MNSQVVQLQSLNSLIIHPALSGIIALLLLSGIYRISLVTFKKLAVQKISLSEISCAMVICIGFIATITYFLSWYGLLYRLPFHIAGYAICLFGVLQIKEWITVAIYKRQVLLAGFRNSFLWSKIDIILLLVFITSLICIVIGPPCDGDSLNYHLGIPLDIINQGTIPVRHDWLYYNLIGLGEFWNLFGLLLGTDCLGSVTQAVALLMLCGVIAEIAVTQERKLFVIKLIASTPVLLFLATGQKPQLIGSAAILASVIILTQKEKLSKKALFLSLGALFFALSLKYTFYLVGSGVFFYLLYRAITSKLIKEFVLLSVFFYVAFLFPLQMHKFLTYGDPVSPILTALFKTDGGFQVQEFYSMLKSYSEGFGFPLGLIVPNSPGFIATVLGIGIFSLLFIKQISGKSVVFILIGTYGIIVNFICGQHTSRFFIEGYFLFFAAFASSLQLRKYQGLFSKAISMQLAVVVGFSCIGAALIFPGSFSWQQRDKVLEHSATDYCADKMLDKQLPQNAFIVSELLANVFLPRPFLAPEYKNMPKTYLMNQIPMAEKPCYLVTKAAAMPDHVLYNYIVDKQIQPFLTWDATRNPFNKKKSAVYIYALENKK